jgi:hypothetical protein
MAEAADVEKPIAPNRVEPLQSDPLLDATPPSLDASASQEVRMTEPALPEQV